MLAFSGEGGGQGLRGLRTNGSQTASCQHRLNSCSIDVDRDSFVPVSSEILVDAVLCSFDSAVGGGVQHGSRGEVYLPETDAEERAAAAVHRQLQVTVGCVES